MIGSDTGADTDAGLVYAVISTVDDIIMLNPV
jgi:hypothetical protein